MVSYNPVEMKQQQNPVHGSGSRILKKQLTSLGLAPANSGPQRPKIYKVKPIHFRELVQKLTGAQLEPQTQPQTRTQTQTQPRRASLQSVAPPPVTLHPHQLCLRNQTDHANVVEEKVPCSMVEQKSVVADKMGWGEGSTELTLSPNFQAWFSLAMLSPGPARMEQRSVL